MKFIPALHVVNDSLTWSSGGVTAASWEYGYDLAGQLTSVSNLFSEQTTYVYDGEGKLTSQTNANGTSTTYVYNEARGWPTTITHTAGGTDFASYELGYDDGLNTVGNLTDVTELDGSTVSYTYDALYRLTAETRTGTGAYTKSYGYDLANNITDMDGAQLATYDAGNKFSSFLGGAVNYFEDGTTRSVPSGGNGLLAGSSWGWHTMGRMVNQSVTGYTSLYYYYDYQGKRRRKAPGSQSGTPRTFYIFDGDQLIGEIYNGAPSVAYTWGADGLVSERLLTGTPRSLWYHYGPQGETRQLTNSAAAVADQYRYTAYGLSLYTSGTDYNPHRYGGKVGYYTEGPNDNAGNISVVFAAAHALAIEGSDQLRGWG